MKLIWLFEVFKGINILTFLQNIYYKLIVILYLRSRKYLEASIHEGIVAVFRAGETKHYEITRSVDFVH